MSHNFNEAKYRNILVEQCKTKEEASELKGKLFAKGFSNVSINDQNEVIILPGTRNMLEGLIDDVILAGFYDAQLVK